MGFNVLVLVSLFFFCRASHADEISKIYLVEKSKISQMQAAYDELKSTKRRSHRQPILNFEEMIAKNTDYVTVQISTITQEDNRNILSLIANNIFTPLRQIEMADPPNRIDFPIPARCLAALETNWSVMTSTP